MKTTKLDLHKFSNVLPDFNKIEQDALYLSEVGALHKCPCGCGFIAITPFNAVTGWTYEINKEDRSLISIRPSILNPGCDTHYYITNGEIELL